MQMTAQPSGVSEWIRMPKVLLPLSQVEVCSSAPTATSLADLSVPALAGGGELDEAVRARHLGDFQFVHVARRSRARPSGWSVPPRTRSPAQRGQRNGERIA